MGLSRDIDPDTIMVGDLNTPLTSTERSVRQKFSKEATDLTQTMGQVDLTCIYRTFHPMDTACPLLPAAFFRIDYIIPHKAHLSN